MRCVQQNLQNSTKQNIKAEVNGKVYHAHGGGFNIGSMAALPKFI